MSSLSERISALSPEKLALLDHRLKRGGEAEPVARIPRRREGDPAPLSFAQERLWFLDQLSPGSPVYNLPITLPLSGRLDLPALTWAMNEIVRRHEALRTTFAAVDGKPVQVIAPSLAIEIAVIDRSPLSPAEREAEAGRLAGLELARRFDLTRGPLLAATLVRLGGERHLLLLTLHHIVADAWSLGILFREIDILYRARCGGQPSPLPELPIQYADFALWQRRWFESGEVAPFLEHWRRQLAGAPAMLELPTDRPRPPVQSFDGAVLPFELRRDLAERIAGLSRGLSVVPFTVLLAGFELLLQRWSGQSDLVVGTPIANRNRTEIEGLIGFFVNMLALRADLSGNPGFGELVRRLREITLGAYTFQDLPFEKLVELLRPERSLSHNPLFQVTFVLQNTPTPGPRQENAPPRGAAPPSAVEVAAATAKFDLTLALVASGEGGQGFSGAIEYNTDLYDRTTVQRLAIHFEALLRAAAEAPGRPIADLPLLSPAERHQLTVEWNATAVPRAGLCLHQLFEAQARRRPGGVAVVCEGRRLTYGDLDLYAGRLARHLRGLGVGPEVPVGIAMERSLEMVIGLLGILKAGGAYLPLDPSYPRERLGFMLAEARVPVLLTEARLAARLPASPASLVCLDALWPALEEEGDGPPPSGAGPDNLAYVIYTSGSTGRPKGSMITHRAIVNRLLWMQEAYRLGESDRVLQKTPFSFDVSVWEFFWPLATGACLVVARPEGHKDGAYLAALIDEQRITTLHFVPSMLPVFLEQVGVSSCRSVRRVISSGEALTAELAAELWRRLPAELHNLYGPTEAAVDVTSWHCRPGELSRSVPIGRPIANLEILVLDRHLRPLPAGVPGELYIGGVGLARGYLSRPGQTAERFVPHPLAERPGERLYRTGDVARFLPAGEIDLLGRLDHQVKVRGYRIELGEIEAALLRCPGVREAAVLVREEGPGDLRLVAFVAAGREPGGRGEELRRLLRAALPEYMVPSAFVEIPALPLTPSGKVDRQALPALAGSGRREGRQGVAPRNPAEAALADIWCEVLKIERVGVFDNFFDLGGHSLLATQVLSRVRDAFGLSLPLRVFFEQPLIASLAELVTANAPERPPGVLPASSASGGEEPLLLGRGAEELLANLDRLPEGEVDALLAELLAGLPEETLAGLLPPPPAAEPAPRTVDVPRAAYRPAPHPPPVAPAPLGADPGAGERLFHEARLAYAAALDRTWGEIQRRSVGYRLIVPDGELANGGRAGYLAALREVWEEGGERLAQEYLRYLEAVQQAWLAMAGSDLDPAALGRIGASLAEAALWAAASLERRGGRER